jgi:VIT1/CCC1 family predicted Fe2+/Mn2+ transporter
VRVWRRMAVPDLRPHAGPVPDTEPTAVVGGKSGTLRAAIFGVNDGLVSNLALIMGMAGAGVGNRVVVLAGVAGLLAGAFSMAAGEYVSMRVQKEVFERLIHVEAHEIGTDPEGETRELSHLFIEKGIPDDIALEAARSLMADPMTALETHAKEELGLDPKELGSPWGAATSSFLTFGAGALLPLVPYFVTQGVAAAWIAVALSLSALFGVGASMTVFTRRPWALSGGRQLLIGGAAALVTYLVGSLLGVAAAG